MNEQRFVVSGRASSTLRVYMAPAPQPNSVDPCPTPDCQVEIVLPNRRRLIVPVSVEPEALARILAVVDGQ